MLRAFMTEEDPNRPIFAHAIHRKFGSRPLFDSNLITSIINYTLYNPWQHTLSGAGLRGNMELARYCIEYDTKEEKLEYIERGLEWAARLGYFDVFVFLAKFGMKNHAEYKINYENLLDSAVRCGRAEIAKYLIDCTEFVSIQINIVNSALYYEQSEIFWCAIKDRVWSQEDLGEMLLRAVKYDNDIVHYLIENGADVNYDSCCAFYIAAAFGPISVLGYLFEQNIDQNRINKALDGAISMNRFDVIDYLFELGVPEDIRIAYICSASRDGYSDILACLLRHGDNQQSMLNDLLYGATIRNRIQIVSYLIKYADIVAFGDAGLIAAAKIGRMDLLKKAFENGADISAYNDRALIFAIQCHHFVMIKYLVEHGARVERSVLQRYKKHLGADTFQFLDQAMADQI
jgi:hypothetical protein